jgi:hypothetical protein
MFVSRQQERLQDMGTCLSSALVQNHALCCCRLLLSQLLLHRLLHANEAGVQPPRRPRSPKATSGRTGACSLAAAAAAAAEARAAQPQPQWWSWTVSDQPTAQFLPLFTIGSTLASRAWEGRNHPGTSPVSAQDRQQAVGGAAAMAPV